MICSEKITLKTLTPLCSHGANQNKVEFRVTELKSLMRFWWRAINNFENVDEMREREEKLFGSTKYKSPLQIRVDSEVNPKYKKWLWTEGIIEGKEINLILSKTNCQQKEDLNYYIDLLKVSLILGGIGNKSRRGGGVLKITKTNVSKQVDIFNELKKLFINLNVDINYDFDKGQFCLIRKKGLKLNYPYLKKVVIVSKELNTNKFEKKAQDAMSKTKKIDYSKIKRMACPVYLSAYGDLNKLYPIISLLYNTNPSDNYKEYVEKFKEVVKE